MEPTIHWGDAILITRPPARLEKDMIVTMDVDGQIVTHRVIQTQPLRTQGDANQVADDWKPEQVQVAGVVRLRLPRLGWVMERLSLARLSQQAGAWFRDQATIPGLIEASWPIPAPESPSATVLPTESPVEKAPVTPAESAPPPASSDSPAQPPATTENPSVPLPETPEKEPTPPESTVEPGDPSPSGEDQPAEGDASP